MDWFHAANEMFDFFVSKNKFLNEAPRHLHDLLEATNKIKSTDKVAVLHGFVAMMITDNVDISQERAKEHDTVTSELLP